MIDFLTSQEEINFYGEELRNKAFTGEGLGCYQNFNINPDYEEILNSDIKLMYFHYFFNTYDLIFNKEDISEYLKELKFFFNLKTNVLMAYHWDGDGTLLFETPHYLLINYDCKKNYTWIKIK